MVSGTQTEGESLLHQERSVRYVEKYRDFIKDNMVNNVAPHFELADHINTLCLPNI